MVGTPRCGVPRPAGRNEHCKIFVFRRLTLRSATRTAQRAVPALIVCELHNPIVKSLTYMLARKLLRRDVVSKTPA
jgi:hypothetical protein